ncbi:hypothetical protein JD509_04980 [Aeromonas veronii]|uniref:hypothetical protein n=1 Tax=Aeromonas veronii TaxID=654 RepID=UPI00191F90FF|nr:hypothetical protein [Aeromonas veronii]MBL0444835.1 hypothetical protein [Aeromonas veronii]
MGQREHIDAAIAYRRLSGLIFQELLLKKQKVINKQQVGERSLSGRYDETEQYHCTEQNTDTYHWIDDVTIFRTASTQRHQLTKQQIVNNQQGCQQNIGGKCQLLSVTDVQAHQNEIGEYQIQQKLLNRFTRIWALFYSCYHACYVLDYT